jgi:hypothetical protein
MARLIENSLITGEMRKASRPNYSLGLMHSDFYLFGHVKQIMASQSFSNAEKLLSAIGPILNGIEKPY